MSNQPLLNTILPPLPKTNNILPLNLSSKEINSFPPLKTPKLQELNKQTVTSLGLQGIKTKPNTPNKIIKPKNKQKKQKSNKMCINIVSLIIIIMIVLFIYKKYN